MPKQLTVNSELDFGIWKGCTVKSVMQVDPGYIRWCLDQSIIKIVKDKRKVKPSKQDKLKQINQRHYEFSV